MAHLAPDPTQRLLGLEIRDVHYPVRAMRVTFDSNAWQMETLVVGSNGWGGWNQVRCFASTPSTHLSH